MAVHDAEHTATAGVDVAGTWTAPDGTIRTASTLTNARGQAAFRLRATLAGGYQFCVTGMSLAGYAYDPGANHVPACQTLAIGP